MLDNINILVELRDDLHSRLKKVHNRSDVSELKIADELDLIETSASYVLMGIRKQSTLTNIVANIGVRIRDKLGKKRDSVKAAKVGVFIIESFVILGIVKLELLPVSNGHTAYHVQSDDDESLTELWELIPNEKSDHLPQFEQPDQWASGVHSNGLPLVRHAPKSVLNSFNLDDHNVLFNAINKMQNTAWMIDETMLGWYVSASNNKDKATYIDENGEGYYAFDHLDPEENRKARSSMKLEATSIKKIAKKLKGEEFFHIYNCDFRGRIYPNTAYLHEQGSDRAKGLLKLSRGKELGRDGFKWFCVNMANNWGNDKVSISDRFDFTTDNYLNLSWLKFAEDPFKNKGWIKADKPWMFLANCLELKRMDDWIQNDLPLDEFISHTVIYIDGSNNGVQHLTAISQDETVAPLVNLVQTELPGDVYMFIADKCWDIVKDNYDPAKDEQLDMLLKDLIAMKIRFDEKHSKEAHKELVEEISAYREANRDKIKEVTANYWHMVTNPKHRRKVCKRPCMTLGYGGTKFGFKSQIIDDTSKVSGHLRFIEYTWASYMGSLIYDVCRGNEATGMEASLPGPAKMLELFETLAMRAADKEEKFKWTVPFTNFPVIQQYRKPEIKRGVRIAFMGDYLRLNIQIMENQSIKKSKQKTAASPNIIHSFDAAHLTMTVNACNFATPTVHDSFGCLPGDMQELFYEVRNQFVNFYENDPLYNLLDEQGALDLMPQLGTLDIRGILDSDFAFL